MSVLITGASGHLGRLTADAVLGRVDASDVILVTRRPDTLSHYADRGADVRFGDFDAPASLDAAFAGAEHVLLISTDAVGSRERQHGAAIEATKRAGVRRVVYTSLVSATDENPATVAADHVATERLLRESGLEVTLLRASIYAEFQAADAAAAAATGRFVTNMGDGRIAYMSRADLARVSAAALTSDGHAGAVYDVTGPELHDAEALAALYGELAGRDVEPVLLDDDAYATFLATQAGLPEPAVALVRSTGTAIRQGFFAVRSTTVEDLTGRRAASLRDVIGEALRAQSGVAS